MAKAMGEAAGKELVAKLKALLAGKSNTGHTHNYAGSASAGGSATSAVKLDTSTAGSATQPAYFTGGKPTACTYSLGSSVPSGAKFTDTTYSAATTSANGLMSSTDKSKLDGIENFTLSDGNGVSVKGEVYIYGDSDLDDECAIEVACGSEFNDVNVSHKTSTGFKHIPSGGSSGQVLTWASDGTAKWGNTSGYLLPTASASTLGGVKVGSNLSIYSGVLSANLGGVTLYSSTSGTQSTVTLSAYASNYSYLDIYYTAGSGNSATSPERSTRVICPTSTMTNKYVVLNIGFTASSQYIQWKHETVRIYGKYIYRVDAGYVNADKSANSVSCGSGGGNTYITRVVGIK